MIRVKLMSILVNDQNRARRFYTEILGFTIKHDIPLGEAALLTLVTPDDADGVELLLEPAGHPAAVALQQALYNDNMPLAQLYTDAIDAEFERDGEWRRVQRRAQNNGADEVCRLRRYVRQSHQARRRLAIMRLARSIASAKNVTICSRTTSSQFADATTPPGAIASDRRMKRAVPERSWPAARHRA